MKVQIHKHALERMAERGATRAEVVSTVITGRTLPAKFGRTKFVKSFRFNAKWLGRKYLQKRVEVFAAPIKTGWLAVTVVVKFF